MFACLQPNKTGLVPTPVAMIMHNPSKDPYKTDELINCLMISEVPSGNQTWHEENHPFTDDSSIKPPFTGELRHLKGPRG
jgi:hypothetical protein